MVNTKISLCGIEIDNPVIPASGTFGFGYEFAELYDINCLGTFSFKGTTKDPRFGNPTPRIAECASGMLNAVGLQNPGVEKVISEELPKLSQVFNKKVMANVSGFAVEDYVYTCEKLDKEEQVGWLEVNISCPNVHGGGMSFGTSAESAYEVTKAVKAATKKPVIIKLSPNVTDIRYCSCLRKRGSRRHQYDKHPDGYENKSQDKEANNRKQDGRLFWSCNSARCHSYGISGV